MGCSDAKPCNRSDCSDCQNERYRKQLELRREVEREYTQSLTAIITELRENKQHPVLYGCIKNDTGKFVLLQQVEDLIKEKFGLEI